MIQRLRQHIYREPNATTLYFGPLWLTWGQPHYVPGIEVALILRKRRYALSLSLMSAPIYDPGEDDGIPF